MPLPNLGSVRVDSEFRGSLKAVFGQSGIFVTRRLMPAIEVRAKSAIPQSAPLLPVEKEPAAKKRRTRRHYSVDALKTPAEPPVLMPPPPPPPPESPLLLPPAPIQDSSPVLPVNPLSPFSFSSGFSINSPLGNSPLGILGSPPLLCSPFSPFLAGLGSVNDFQSLSPLRLSSPKIKVESTPSGPRTGFLSQTRLFD